MTERRKRRRRRLAALTFVAALGAGLYWLLQFSGLGIDIPGLEKLQDSERAEEPPPPDAAPAEPKVACELRLDEAGLHLDGRSVSTEEAIAACRPAGKAMLVVTGDARYGAFERTRQSLEQSGIAVHVR